MLPDTDIFVYISNVCLQEPSIFKRFSGTADPLTAVFLVAVVAAVVLVVALEGAGDAGAGVYAAELNAGVARRGGCSRSERKKDLEMQKLITIYSILPPLLVGPCYSRHSCSSLMSPQSLSLSHIQMLLMHLPLEQRYWLGRQVCSVYETRTFNAL